MSDLSPIGVSQNSSTSAVNRIAATSFHSEVGRAVQGEQATPAATSDNQDRVELSSFAKYLDQLRQLPDVRQGRVDHVRSAIEANTYESDAKLDAAIEQWAREEL